MADPSTILIEIDGNDITNDVLFDSARFELQQNAVPGAWSFIVKDVDHTYAFVEGDEMTCTIDSTKVIAGPLLRIGRAFPMAVVDTTTPADVTRYWKLTGADWNFALGKRVTRNMSDPPDSLLERIPYFTGDKYDGELITQLGEDYLDATEFDHSTFVDNIRPPRNGTPDASKRGDWLQQGTIWRKQIEDFTQFTGALFFIDANKNVHHHAIEDSVKRWGFSDVPNNAPITASPPTYQGATIGFRELDATESGEHFVNDVFVWGGSAFTGSGATVFSREQNATSITAHGRWQMAEVHFGEEGYKSQEGVDSRADAIVIGPPGAVAADQQRGLSYPQWQLRLSWFAHLVPTLGGLVDHLLPGELSTITLETFDEDDDPLVLLLPLRTVTMSFPTIPSDNPGGDALTYVRFDGMFGLQPDDPFSLWRFLRKTQPKVASTVLTTVDQDSDSTIYGAFYQGTAEPTPDGSETVFTIQFGYIPGTLSIFLNGLAQSEDAFTESDPAAGEFTLSEAPFSDDVILVICRTTAT